MSATKEIKKGTRVKYFQPGLDEILTRWSGKRTRMGDPGGSLKEAIITKVVRDRTSAGMQTFYYTKEGVMLTDSDIRETLS